jgi:hypothetical protein
MNRIRKYNNKYQVLFTPHQKYNTGFEFLLGSWTDEGLMRFEVKEFNTYTEAECVAMEHPDINWDQLVDYHKDQYIELKDHINAIIKNTSMATQFKAQLLTPEQTKNKMFDRVIKGQQLLQSKNSTSGYRINFEMNDIISFLITNPWTKNLREMESHLLRDDRLNIFNIIRKNSVVHLVGRTDLGTSYEIVLVPTLLDNWMDWRNINYNLPIARQLSELKNCINTQKLMDNTPVLR